MSDQLWVIEIEPQVRDWLERLSTADHDKVEAAVDFRLLPDPLKARMPGAKPLGDGVWELRFDLGDSTMRIPYWLAPGRRIVLTVFRKTRQVEHAEVEKAKVAQKTCEAEHGPAEHEYQRTEEER
ncbi:type II toxin-antitoxin system RelE/ParE family toxin [Streptomyces sp. NPDC058471]|uniref:type II toxin-antitoxin system RelE/ParE family toxin n=1 Tax=Streptomyces sp. NPDC058471 TaxID=3346516 RepID=UPI00364990F5